MNSKLAQQPASESDRRSDEQLIGSVLSGRYRVDSLLGSGATGRVYAAEHVMMQKRVALKILHHELSSVPELIARFEREATAAASIEHPNVVSATDFGKLDNGDLFLVLELVQGTSLRDEIVKGPFRVERAVNIASQIASGLAAAHALGIVHRDLKPENIMLVTRGGNADFVKILDFGIAKMAVGSGGTAEPLTRIGVVFGTPEYMAPEQALGQPADARSDIYSLGVLIYEMLSGLRPFQSEGQATIIAQQLAQPPIPLSERVPTLGIPPALEALVSKLLARDASERYQSAAELADELKALTRAGVGGQYFTLLNGSPPNVVTTENAAPQEIARAEYKPTFLPSDPLPSFTFPPLDDDAQILTKASEQARAIAEQLAEPTTAEAPQRSRTELGRSGATVPVSATGSQLEIASASKPDSRGTRVHDAIRRGRELFQKIGQGLARRVALACRWIDERRATLPVGLRKVLSKVPAEAILGALIFIAVFPFIAVAIVLASGGREISAVRSDAVPLAASASTLSVAPAPLDEKTLQQIALAETHIKQRKWIDAVTLAKSVLAYNPALSQNERVAAILAEAARHSVSSRGALLLLQDSMGAKGAEIVYDLAAALDTPQTIRLEAGNWLRSEDFERVAPPALLIAGKLRAARGCKEKQALLEQAGKVGDQRALEYLKLLAVPAGCGRRARDDCFPCLRSDNRVADAIRAIEHRTAEGPRQRL